MAARRTTKFTWIVTIALAAVFVWGTWYLMALHVTEPRGSMTAIEAKSVVPIPLPPEASNVRYAAYSKWIEYSQFVRLEAPVPVCLRLAASLVPNQKLERVDPLELPSEAYQTRPGIFRDFHWFDLAQAKNVVSAGGGPSQPQVWVDQSRGVFYYRKTD